MQIILHVVRWNDYGKEFIHYILNILFTYGIFMRMNDKSIEVIRTIVNRRTYANVALGGG